MSNKLPPRWLNCPRKSLEFIGNKFIVFKTPLSDKFDEVVPEASRFPPKMILEHMKMSKARIGLWIDLTKTNRYYSKSEIESNNIIYFKLNCAGHEQAPTPDQTKEFIDQCRDFIESNSTDYIGVHCTHGFNRSGFLVCSFLVEEFDFSIRTAVVVFAKMRPPGIYKAEYLQELWDRYSNAEDDGPCPPAPELPGWCFEETAPEEETSQDSRDPPNKRRRLNEFVKKDPKFMEGVDNVEPLTDINEQFNIQKTVQSICGWQGVGFPGSQPISMDKDNIMKLHEKPYMLSWKADGTRYLMYIHDRYHIYFVDRDNTVFLINGLTFPLRKPTHEEQYLSNTLVDGEMVIDIVENKSTPRFLIYDIIQFNGKDVSKLGFRHRLSCIQDEIVKPRYSAVARGTIDRSSEPFGVRLKDFWPADFNAANKLLNGSFQQMLTHEPDGLIFQPEMDPYQCGRCDNVLKWKPPELNTIDFRLKIVRLTGEGILPTNVGELYVGRMNQPFAHMKPLPKSAIKYDGKIVECSYDFPTNNWKFLRERTDKSFPNAYETAAAVAKSIRHPVTKDMLLQFIRDRSYHAIR